MNIEYKVLIYSMINNLIISLMKIISGITCKVSSLLADGLHTFSDFLTDVISLVGSKISKKRPTKFHPFGFGKVEYLTNLMVGFILFILGIYIIISSFFKEPIIPTTSLIIVLVISLILKLIAIFIMNKIGKDINSNVLITSVSESKADLYSSFGVIIIILLLQFSDSIPILKYSDLIGSIIIGLIVLKTSLKIIIDNSLCIIGTVEEDETINNEVKEFLNKYKKVHNSEISLIKYGSYYKLQLNLEIDNSLTLRQITNLVNKIKKEIKNHRSFKIKYVTIYVTNKL